MNQKQASQKQSRKRARRNLKLKTNKILLHFNQCFWNNRCLNRFVQSNAVFCY